MFQQKIKKKLQMIYSNVCDSIKIKFLEHNKYFCFIHYDFSRKLWIYFIKRKSNML